MTSNFTDLITKLLKEYDKTIYKHKNFTDTYTTEHLEKFSIAVRDWVMHLHSAEDREAMTHENQQEYDEWMEENIDRMAEELKEETSIILDQALKNKRKYIN